MGNLIYRPMEEQEFERYMPSYLEEYIKDLSEYKDEFIKQMENDPREFAERQFKESLPQGLKSPNNFFWIIIDKKNAETVGFFWFTVISDRNLSLLSHLKVFDKYRNMGYGSEALEFWEKYVRETHPEVHRLYLHVFKHNYAAQNFCEKNGFLLFYESFEGNNLIKELYVNE